MDVMKINCRFCGASVDSTAKICPGCGKVMPAYHGAQLNKKSQFSNADKHDGLAVARIQVQTPYSATRSGRMMDRLDENYGTPKARREHMPDNYDPRKDNKTIPYTVATGSGKQAQRSVLSSGIAYGIRFILMIIIGLLLYAVIRVYMVTKASYDFDIDKNIKLASKNYGEAFDSYFVESKWWFDFSQNKVTFSGTDSDGRNYSMVFGKDDKGQTVVKELNIDGKKIYNDDNVIMDNYILGTFMSEKEIQHATAMGKGVTESMI